MQPTLNIGLIPDGTRRWARREELPLSDAYWKTMLNIHKIIDYLYSQNSLTISIYLLSKQNLGREPNELEAVINAETDLIKILLPPLLEKWEVNLSVAGCLDQVPEKLSQSVRKLSCVSSKETHLRKLYLLIGYDSYDEIDYATKSANKTLSWFDYLWVPQKLDLVIRTGGEFRLSNFLPLQSTYAELFFVEQYFNDFDLHQLSSLLQEYRNRNKRYGK